MVVSDEACGCVIGGGWWWLWTYGGVAEWNGGDSGRRERVAEMRERVSLCFSLIKVYFSLLLIHGKTNTLNSVCLFVLNGQVLVF